jgi:hypothetical protein
LSFLGVVAWIKGELASHAVDEDDDAAGAAVDPYASGGLEGVGRIGPVEYMPAAAARLPDDVDLSGVLRGDAEKGFEGCGSSIGPV